MEMRRPSPFLLAIALAVSAAALVRADDLVLSRFSDYLDALRTQTGIPGLSAAIVGQADVMWEASFGRQDVQSNVFASPNTSYQLDGTTEAIVSSLAMRCASDGWLQLDDPVSKFAPSSAEPNATIRQLLTHTTLGPNGLTFSYRPDRLGPVAAAIAGCTDSSFRWGMSQLFERMGMYDSVPGMDVLQLTPPAEGFTTAELQRYRDTVRRLATPYSVDASGRASSSGYNAPTLTPASGLVSTVRDLEQFDLALKKGVLLRPDWRTLAWTPPTDAGGQPLPHAYGWFVQNYNGGRLVWQFGVGANASSSMIISVPERGLTLILLANSQGLARPFDLSTGDITVSPFARLFLSVFIR
jgi:CubicO group peptidase (beta-lactamase class C family)